MAHAGTGTMAHACTRLQWHNGTRLQWHTLAMVFILSSHEKPVSCLKNEQTTLFY